VGTSLNFVVGQTYDINVGPQRVKVDIHQGPNPGTVVATTVIVAICTVFVIAYQAIHDDSARATFVAVSIVLVELFLAYLMVTNDLTLDPDKESIPKVYSKAYDAESTLSRDPGQFQEVYGAWAMLGNMWALPILAYLAIVQGEKDLQAKENSGSSS
jgi:hypothetical protein